MAEAVEKVLFLSWLSISNFIDERFKILAGGTAENPVSPYMTL
jgi:hypothetical protein